MNSMSEIEATYSKLMKQLPLRGLDRKKEIVVLVAGVILLLKMMMKKKKIINHSQLRKARVPVKNKVWMTALKRL